MRRVVSERSPPVLVSLGPRDRTRASGGIYERTKLNSLLEAQEAVCNLPSSLAVAVIVAGKVRKWKGQLLDVDLKHLRRQLEASRDHIFAAAGIQQDLFRSD